MYLEGLLVFEEPVSGAQLPPHRHVLDRHHVLVDAEEVLLVGGEHGPPRAHVRLVGQNPVPLLDELHARPDLSDIQQHQEHIIVKLDWGAHHYYEFYMFIRIKTS